MIHGGHPPLLPAELSAITIISELCSRARGGTQKFMIAEHLLIDGEGDGELEVEEEPPLLRVESSLFFNI